MAVEKYEGIHTTCNTKAENILKEGFWLSPQERYVGAGVYFYNKAKKGLTWAEKYRIKNIKKKCILFDGSEGVLLSAQITCDSKFILDLEEGEFFEELNYLLDKFYQKWDAELRLINPGEKNNLLNALRIEFVKGLEKLFNIKYDMIKIELPYKRGCYGSGFVVYKTSCISDVSYCYTGDIA